VLGHVAQGVPADSEGKHQRLHRGAGADPGLVSGDPSLRQGSHHGRKGLNRRTFVEAMSRVTGFPGGYSPVLTYGPHKFYGPSEFRVVKLHTNKPPSSQCKRGPAPAPPAGVCWVVVQGGRRCRRRMSWKPRTAPAMKVQVTHAISVGWAERSWPVQFRRCGSNVLLPTFKREGVEGGARRPLPLEARRMPHCRISQWSDNAHPAALYRARIVFHADRPLVVVGGARGPRRRVRATRCGDARGMIVRVLRAAVRSCAGAVPADGRWRRRHRPFRRATKRLQHR